MWTFRRKNLLPAVLDVGGDGIRLMQLSCDAGAIRIETAARRLFANDQNAATKVSRNLSGMGGPPMSCTENHGRAARAASDDIGFHPRTITDELRQMLSETPTANRRVIAALPSHLVHLRTFRLAPTAADQLEAAVRVAASESFPFDLADATLRFFAAGAIRQEGQERIEVIAAAARRTDIAGFLSSLHAAGLRPRALRLAPLAAYGCAVRAVAAADSTPLAVIDVGSEFSHVVFGRGEQISFIKRMDIGGRHLNQAVAKKLDLTLDEVIDLRRRIACSKEAMETPRDGIAGTIFDATRGLLEDLAREVGACFRYHAITFRGPRPNRIALLGSESSDPHLRRVLAAAIPGTIEAIDPLAGIDTGALRTIYREAPSGEWTTCIGLASSATSRIVCEQKNEIGVIDAAGADDVSRDGAVAAA